VREKESNEHTIQQKQSQIQNCEDKKKKKKSRASGMVQVIEHVLNMQKDGVPSPDPPNICKPNLRDRSGELARKNGHSAR
jgi:hypothetical protein